MPTNVTTEAYFNQGFSMGQEAWPYLEGIPLDTPLINLAATLQARGVSQYTISSIYQMLSHYAQAFARREHRIANYGDLVALRTLHPKDLQAQPRVGAKFEGFIVAGITTTEQSSNRTRTMSPLLADAS